MTTKEEIREAMRKAGFPQGYDPEIPILAAKIDQQRFRTNRQTGNVFPSRGLPAGIENLGTVEMCPQCTGTAACSCIGCQNRGSCNHCINHGVLRHAMTPEQLQKFYDTKSEHEHDCEAMGCNEEGY